MLKHQPQCNHPTIQWIPARGSERQRKRIHSSTHQIFHHVIPCDEGDPGPIVKMLKHQPQCNHPTIQWIPARGSERQRKRIHSSTHQIFHHVIPGDEGDPGPIVKMLKHQPQCNHPTIQWIPARGSERQRKRILRSSQLFFVIVNPFTKLVDKAY